MGLRDYQVPTETVDLGKGNSFEVRGISFEDLSRIVQRHGPVCVLVFNQFMEMKQKFGLRPEAVGQLLTMALDKFPDAVSELIAISADERELTAMVRKLPLTIQLDAIEKIVGLTFTGEADVKKLVEVVTRMAMGVTASMTSLTAANPSVSGSGSFVSQ